jgi:hypothetical protein
MRGKIYPKKISQKAKKSENKRENHPKKPNFKAKMASKRLRRNYKNRKQYTMSRRTLR